jgi:C-terminal processing protease CtpA/Prc
LSAIREIDFNQAGRLFVIIGRSTFSAGKDFALDVARNTEAIFVGEPTGGMPNNYGYSVIVRLPNSGIEVGIASTYVFKGRSQDLDPWLEPDIVVPVTAADYFAGRDAALEAVIQHED